MEEVTKSQKAALDWMLKEEKEWASQQLVQRHSSIQAPDPSLDSMYHFPVANVKVHGNEGTVTSAEL